MRTTRVIGGRKQRVQDRRRATLALGKPLLSTQPIHHHTSTQLVICQDRDYHVLLHARERIFKHGGNPNTDVLCPRCSRPLLPTDLIRCRFLDHEYLRCNKCTGYLPYVPSDLRAKYYKRFSPTLFFGPYADKYGDFCR